MGIVSGFVLYAIIWFMILMMVLPIRLETQQDRGKVTYGTQSGSPVDPKMKKRFLVTTLIATVLWAVIAAVIISGVITIENIDIFDRLNS